LRKYGKEKNNENNIQSSVIAKDAIQGTYEGKNKMSNEVVLLLMCCAFICWLGGMAYILTRKE
jgi:hypothetical protein